MSLNVKVSAIGLMDMLKFKNQTKVREETIRKGSAAPLPKDFGANATARKMHPEQQELMVSQIITRSPDVKTFVFQTVDGKSAAAFRAGQYLSFSLELDGSVFTRPVSICSSPAEARRGRYAITVKRAGFASDYELDNWQVGQPVVASAPLGSFYYTGLRDAKKVIALAGGVGITPFISMAKAIADGDEDFELTVLYGTRTLADALFTEEFADAAKRSGGKVKVVHVLSDETAEDCEHGFLTAELIRKYMDGQQCSLFMAGPQAMYRFLNGEIEKLGIERKWVRRELFGASKQPWTLPGYPEVHRGKTYQVTLRRCGETFTFPANADESLLVAIERAGVKTISHCRSGECGWCRSRLLSGNVFIPDETDGRRAADRLYGYIHPCASYPISDLELEVPHA